MLRDKNMVKKQKIVIDFEVINLRYRCTVKKSMNIYIVNEREMQIFDGKRRKLCAQKRAKIGKRKRK